MVYETAISLGVVLSAFIFVYIGIKIKGKGYEVLQGLFLLITIFILFSHLSILSIIAENDGETEIQGIINDLSAVYLYIGIFLIAYFIIMFIVTLVRGGFGKSKKRDQESKYEIFE